jgi:hypothetical protein
VIALGILAAVGGVLGAAGLTFDGHFEVFRLVFTLPFALAAALGSVRAPRYSAAFLLGESVGAFVIETWTAHVNRQGCVLLSQLLSTGPGTLNCSPIGLASMLLALIAAGIATGIVISTLRDARGVVLGVAGLVLAPIVLYMLSIATFALGGA